MNYFIEGVLLLSGVISLYALLVATMSFLAVRRKRYEAYRRKRADFSRLDREVKEAFEK